MNKDLIKIIGLAMFVLGIVMILIWLGKKSTQIFTLINPKPGIYTIEIFPNKEYVQLKIINNQVGTFTVSLKINE